MGTSHDDRAGRGGKRAKPYRHFALHESLERLAAFDPQQAHIVELRYFAGLTLDETAEVVGISEATVSREWTIAKAWLRANLSDHAS